MQIPVLSGIYADSAANFRTSYPVNMQPESVESGLSQGYLRTCEGISQFATGQGADRGAIFWSGYMYRVSGSSLIRVNQNGAAAVVGSVPGLGPVSMAYSFDRLSISNGQQLFYFDGVSVTQVTDSDLGDCVDHDWIDGYFFSTDGEFLVTSDLSDPYSVNPLKYGSSEVDPDPVLGVLKVMDEIYVFGRFTTEIFDNIGGAGFAFARVGGGLTMKGIVGTHAKTLVRSSVVFVGGGRNESVGVWIKQGGAISELSTPEICRMLADLTDQQLAAIECESRLVNGADLIYVHTENWTAVYDMKASEETQKRVWFFVSSATSGAPQAYRGRHFVNAWGRWFCGDTDSSNIGEMTDATPSHFGDDVGWRFDTVLLYNGGKGAIQHSVELVGAMGLLASGGLRESKASMTYTQNGRTWSMDRWISMGAPGDYGKRPIWRRCGVFRNWRGLRFRGVASAPFSVARIETELEPLNG